MNSERLQYLEKLAGEILGDRAAGAAWLRQPVSTMEGQVPVDIMDTQEGFDSIMDTLRKMKTGKVTSDRWDAPP